VAEIEQLARGTIDAWNRMDADGFAALCTEDVELYLPRNLLEGGGYRGADGIRRAMADARDSWDEVTLEFCDARAAGDRGVIHAHSKNRSHSGGPALEYEVWNAVRIRDGLVNYFRSHLDEADALADAGI
jgi:ketosteroid isomerase-like protein